ncbi:UPF0146 family protein [Methanospirillum stamsii]|uniref:UPF0146 protein DLD82_05695 n=1 Tax=Methanospirillum stamsii TaxID=1277351 RepID=A0A2V2NFV4_9EURY|nr:UPF0146 family protein [Methanospirillum stamsii]PWR75277.1 hypothetical protein DLD82_05695 [Methanospirillum stamsii]
MSGYKHIETVIARYIAGRYNSVIETGAGSNLHAANLLFRAGVLIRCSDIVVPQLSLSIPYVYDDVFHPNLSYYSDSDCIYAIRPTEEMIPALIRLAKKVRTDLYIYHLGFEGTDCPAPVKGCEVPLHHYVKIKN